MYLHLQRRVGQETEQVRLCCYLQWHKIEYGNAQGTNILMLCPLIAQHKDVLFLEILYRWQFIR